MRIVNVDVDVDGIPMCNHHYQHLMIEPFLGLSSHTSSTHKSAGEILDSSSSESSQTNEWWSIKIYVQSVKLELYLSTRIKC